MPTLFDQLREIKQNVIRNIVSILPPADAFSDLNKNKSAAAIANKAMQQVLQHSLQDEQFHFTAAIGYPFETDHFMASRYTDGSFPVWYGSMDKITSIYETAYHALKALLAIENIEQYEFISRKRSVYDVQCQGLFIDLSAKEAEYPQLTAEDYQFSQMMAKQISQQGYPGLLAPSARYQQGTNINVFKQSVLSQPKINCELTYRLYPQQKMVQIYQQRKMLQEIIW